jgi:hypothetical protein
MSMHRTLLAAAALSAMAVAGTPTFASSDAVARGIAAVAQANQGQGQIRAALITKLQTAARQAQFNNPWFLPAYGNGPTAGLSAPTISLSTTAPSSGYNLIPYDGTSTRILMSGGTPVAVGAHGYAAMGASNIPAVVSFTGTISGSVLTAAAPSSGVFTVGQFITGPGVPSQCELTSFAGGAGGAGTYNLSCSATIGASEAMTAYVAGNICCTTSDLAANQSQHIDEWGTAAQEFTISVNAESSTLYRLAIDGQYISKTAVSLSGTCDASGFNPCYITVNWGSGNAPHTYRLELDGTSSLSSGGILVGLYLPAATGSTTIAQFDAWPPAGSPQVWANFRGDSYSQGVTGPVGGFSEDSWVTTAALMLGWRYDDSALASTGYLQSTVSHGPESDAERRADLTRRGIQYDVIVEPQGYNDSAYTQSQIQAASVAEWQNDRLLFPNALIIVVGPWTPPPTYTLGALTAAWPSNGVAAAYTQWGDTHSCYIASGLAPTPWQVGSGYSGSTNGYGNNDVFVGTDGVHPTKVGSGSGHYYLAQRFAEAVRNCVATAK